MTLSHVCAVASTGCALLVVGLVTAGPLDPPAGAPAPTYKTLAEVEPRIPIGPATTPGDADSVYLISQPGSYYLTGPIAGVVGRHGVKIAADSVSIDLMGHEMLGVPGSLNGVTADDDVKNFSVANGDVRGWGWSGIAVPGIGARIEGVTVNGNGFYGVNVGNAGVISGCTATQNSIGFSVNRGAVLTRCTASQNDIGFSLTASVISECAALENSSNGYEGIGSSVYRNCTATSNSGSGFMVGSGSSISGCAAATNLGHGILAASRASVTDCAVSGNGAYGIQVSDHSLVRGNTCNGNGANADAAGILAQSTNSRIEANHCSGNDIGVQVAGADNVIIRNSVSGNTMFGFSIAAGNGFGPNIFDSAGIGNSHNPHSNYEF